MIVYGSARRGLRIEKEDKLEVFEDDIIEKKNSRIYREREVFYYARGFL